MRAYERLLNYVRVYTTSDPESGTHPSAAREFDLAHQLVEELKALGVEDARVDEHCYVYGSLPEHRELGPGVPHDQTGHAGGAGGREHGVDHPHPPVAAGNGQRQQQRTQCDHDHKTDADDLGRAVPPRFVPVLCTMMPEWVLEWLFHTFLRRQHTPALPLSFSPL